MCISGGYFLHYRKTPIVGMRQWGVSAKGLLHGTFVSASRWFTKSKTTKDRISPNCYPDNGLHALARRSQLGTSYVWGQVICSGVIAVFKNNGRIQGTLSQKQTIVKLWIPKYVRVGGCFSNNLSLTARRKLATALRKRYKVPVVVL